MHISRFMGIGTGLSTGQVIKMCAGLQPDTVGQAISIEALTDHSLQNLAPQKTESSYSLSQPQITSVEDMTETPNATRPHYTQVNSNTFDATQAKRFIDLLDYQRISPEDIQEIIACVADLDHSERQLPNKANPDNLSSYVRNELKTGSWRDLVTIKLLDSIDWDSQIRAYESSKTKPTDIGNYVKTNNPMIELYRFLVMRELFTTTSWSLPVRDPNLLKYLKPEQLSLLVKKMINRVDAISQYIDENDFLPSTIRQASPLAKASLKEADKFFHEIIGMARSIFEKNHLIFKSVDQENFGDLERYVAIHREYIDTYNEQLKMIQNAFNMLEPQYF